MPSRPPSRSKSNRPLPRNPRAPRTCRRCSPASARVSSELDRRLEAEGGDPRADEVLQEFLRNEVALYQVVVAGTAVARWRRYGEEWHVADPPLPAGEGDLLTQLEPLMELGDDMTFLLFVPDADVEPLYWTAQALRDEIALRRDEIRAYYPPPRGEQ